MESFFQNILQRPNMKKRKNRICFESGRVSRAQPVAIHHTPLHPWQVLEPQTFKEPSWNLIDLNHNTEQRLC